MSSLTVPWSISSGVRSAVGTYIQPPPEQRHTAEKQTEASLWQKRAAASPDWRKPLRFRKQRTQLRPNQELRGQMSLSVYLESCVLVRVVVGFWVINRAVICSGYFQLAACRNTAASSHHLSHFVPQVSRLKQHRLFNTFIKAAITSNLLIFNVQRWYH